MSTEDNKANVRRGYEEGFNQRNLAIFDESIDRLSRQEVLRCEIT